MKRFIVVFMLFFAVGVFAQNDSFVEELKEVPQFIIGNWYTDTIILYDGNNKVKEELDFGRVQLVCSFTKTQFVVYGKVHDITKIEVHKDHSNGQLWYIFTIPTYRKDSNMETTFTGDYFLMRVYNFAEDDPGYMLVPAVRK